MLCITHSSWSLAAWACVRERKRPPGRAAREENRSDSLCLKGFWCYDNGKRTAVLLYRRSAIRLVSLKWLGVVEFAAC